MTLLIGILLYFVLPEPWDLVALGVAAVLEVAEIAWGVRLRRKWQPKTGAETMIGTTAEVVEPCRPVGMVRVRGELWRASGAPDAAVGERVRITALEDLTLTVEPLGDKPRPASAASA